MSDREFNFLRRIAKECTGITLADYKRNMLYRRVSKRLRALNLDNIKSYCEILSGPDADDEIPLFVNSVTTNKTSFFREPHHFEHLGQVALPKLRAAAQGGSSRRLRIWSAGCSSGEESYSIAMTMQDELSDWDALVLATDIDTEMVEAGRSGLYPRDASQWIPAQLRERYVDSTARDHTKCRMSEKLRSTIVFKQLNLLDQWPMKGPFDAIFCRNVVIYFDKPTQQTLFDRFADILRPGSFLYIGHSESLFGISDRFRPIGQSMYQRIS